MSDASKPNHCAACGAEQASEVPACAHCGVAAVDVGTRPEPSLLDDIRAQQQRVAQQLAPLEAQRNWWKKYF